jgi:hypothetical protein
VKIADIAGTKRRNLLRAKIDDLEINSKIKDIGNLYRGINDFKKSYQPRTNIVKDEKGDLVRHPQYRRRNHFSQLLNIHRVNDVRQTDIP